jgi:hypothetical protein
MTLPHLVKTLLDVPNLIEFISHWILRVEDLSDWQNGCTLALDYAGGPGI